MNRYPLSKEIMSLYLACTMNPERKYAYLVGWSVELPKDTDKERIRAAIKKLFERHRIFAARIKEDENGELFMYDCGEEPVIETAQSENDTPAPEDYYIDMDLKDSRMYRNVIVDTPSSVWLFMIFHHIILDGTGRQNMVRDFEAVWKGEEIGGADLLPYEFAIKEREQEKSEEFEADRSYYTDLLSGIESLPPEYDKKDENESFSQFFHPFESIDAKAVRAKKESSGVRTSTIFTAATGYAIALFSGSKQGIVASAMSGRTEEIKNSTGMFVRTIPMICDIDASRSVDDFLKDIDEQTTGGRKHSLFTYLDMSRECDFSAPVCFAYQGDMIADRIMFDGEERRMGFLRADASDYEMRLYLWRKDGKYLFEAVYRSDHYSRAYMDALAETVEQILSEILIKEKMSQICAISPQQEVLQNGFNKTESPYDRTQTVVSLFESSVRKFPDRTAIIFKEREYTYREVDELAEKIAAFIMQKGLGRSDAVSVLIPRCEYMYIASLGILKAGCAYQPLDTTYPEERLNFMVKDSGARLLISTKELRPILTEYAGDVLFLDDIPALPLPAEKVNADVKPQDTFILLYTSGSTGVPKGVKLTHANIVCNINWYIKRYELTEEDRCGEYASYGFDMHMYDPYSALSAGAAAVVVPDEYRLDFHELNGYYKKNKVTHVFMTTQVGRQFAVSVDDCSLKSLTVGGEKLVTLDPPKGYTFINGYGPTETTMLVSAMDVVKAEMNIPIGKPLDNTKLYVVDENLRRLPVGAIGELLIAGLRVGDGYLNRPDKTAEVFIKNPFDSGEYENAYRSGDIVRYRSDGNIEFIGRRDGQVKINGFRIELTEVEAVIRDYPGVKDATVAAFDHPAGGKFIAAYVVGDEPLDADAIGEFIKERKPPYMVPAAFMQLEKIPLNQNSKVNKRALPKPELKSHAKSADPGNAAPLNVLEKELKDIVAKIVNSEDFGITDHLGDLGITSISGISLATAVFRKYGVQVKVRELVSHGSIQSIENDILTHLLYSQKEEKEAEKPADKISGSKKACRLTFAQQGVFAECQANPDTVQYNIPVDISMPEGVDENRLEAAVRTVIDAHPYIKCRFVPDKDGEIIQEPIPDLELQIPVREMSDTEFDRYRQKFVRPFDLSSGPAFRFEIIKTGNKVHLLADLHHLISDGASEDIFVKQLCLALDGKEIEKESYDYYAFAAEETIDEETEAFFEEKMADAGEATRIIPDVFEEGLPHTERSVETVTDISSVTEFSKKAGITPASMYLAAAFLTLSRFVCEDTAAIATVSNGRSNLKLSDTMGMFVNTLPLSARIDNSEKTEDYLKRVSKLFSDTIAHENYSFARIASKYDFHPSVSFTYQIGVMNEYGTKEGKADVSVLKLDIAKIPVALYIDGTPEKASIRVNYDSSMYSEDIALAIAQSMENVVEGLMRQERISGISLTDEKQWKVLDGYNSPWDLEYDRNDSAVSVFRRTAASHPDKIAAVFKDKSYTYRELDELTDELAAKIYDTVSKAAGKKDLRELVTAILLPRDENVFIMPLAVIKTGMAYEPLDPAYPKDRLNFMVNDAKASLLISADDLADLVDEYKGPILKVSELVSMEKKEPVAAEPSPKDMFIMLYTSGSTGTPKGCQIEHGNLVAYAHGVRNDFYREDDRIAAYASFGFDVNMSDIFCTLLNGGTVYLIPEEIRMELGALASYFDREGITALLLTTQVGVQFLQNYPKLKTLRMLVMGGEKLPAVDPKALSYTIVNGYGPTENCCGVSLFPIREWEPNIPIGKPMATIHGYVLDRTGHRLPAGAAGEYCLAGPQVSRGYLNRPDKTAEAYEDCPFGQFRMYHTGDIVRYRTNGDVEFVGRKDGQVKIRGFRIETREIEAVIREYEGVRNVTVQAYDYEGGGKYLAAFVVSSDTVDTEKLAGFIKERKPAYMVPAVIMQIEEIPLTVNQKVDRKSLPAPKLQKAAYVAPVGRTEEDFCAIFGQVLGIEKVSAEDDFFDIGGSSILAMKVVLAAGKAGYDIVYNDVFTYTTPRELAGFVNKEDKAAPQSLIPETVTSDEIPSTGPDGYDYTAIHELMEKNTIEAFKNGTRRPISKDVLLLGATGYLGSHVLRELITSHECRIFCFVRAGKDQSGEDRLKKILKAYFDDDHAQLFSSRITVVEGDVTDENAVLGFEAPSEDMMVINCAASVKHFAKDDEIERMNVGSVRNLIKWCEKTGSRLVHISTCSVMGNRVNNMPPRSFRLDERRLFAGQEIDSSQYIHSKFMAERLIYEEILKNGLKGKVIRVANLAPRDKDGVFQINYDTNSFMKSFRAYAALGKISYDAMNVQTEFSPIDCVARAVVLLSGAPDECVCHMLLNPHRPLIGDVINVMRDMGYPVQAVEPETFAGALNDALADDDLSETVSSLIAYKKNSNIETIGLEGCDNSLTLRMLERLGYSWPQADQSYIRRFLEKLIEKDYFKRKG